LSPTLSEAKQQAEKAASSEASLALVAAGLISFGFYCFIEARYREV
jgi:hypothetical protein